MDDVLQHLEAALKSVEERVEENPVFQDLVNRLNDVKNHVVSVKAELEATAAPAEPATPVEAPASPAPETEQPETPAPAENEQTTQEGQPVGPADDPQTAKAPVDQVTNEDGTPVTDPNAAR
jgi:DNA replication initiation complex subunit (GINS family)